MKYSKQRNIILDIVKSSFDHPTAEEVYARARDVMPTMGIATVYRNLNALAERGDIIRIPNAGANDRFDGRLEEHYHILCPCCGGLTDIFPIDHRRKDGIKREACKLFGIDPEEELTVSGTLFEKVCDNCRD